MPPLTVLSQSSLQDYHDCPRRFELRYLRRLEYPAIEAEPALENERRRQEGEYFHRMAQQYFAGIPAGSIAKTANTENLQRWWENFINDQDLSSLRDLTGLAAETTLSAPLGNFRLLAKYDLIAVGADKVTIYDWKTYHVRPKNERMLLRWQTRTYRALLARAKAFPPEQIEMVYWYADFPSEPARFAYTAEQLKRDWDALEKLAGEIFSAASFPLTEEAARCSYCMYRSYCGRGIGAGAASDAELESETAELFDINFEQIGEIAF